MPRRLQSDFIEGPAGRLETLHEVPDEDVSIERAAVICHPHPLYGGTMHNKVVFRLARAARRAGSAVLRFNFRGVGNSEGSYDSGNGEQEDLRAALRYLEDRYNDLPLVAAGFSFGARIGLRVCCSDPSVERFIAVGVPVKYNNWEFLNQCHCPKFFIQSENDEHGPRPTMEDVFSRAAGPKEISWINASDHFFVDALDDLEEAAYKAFQAEIEQSS